MEANLAMDENPYGVLHIMVRALVSQAACLSFSRVAAARRIPVCLPRPSVSFGIPPAQTPDTRAGMTRAAMLEQNRCHYLLQFSIVHPRRLRRFLVPASLSSHNLNKSDITKVCARY